MSTHARVTREQWQALDDVLAEICQRTGGGVEDLHDRAVGILDSVRPAEWCVRPGTESVVALSLWRHARRVIGALAHLQDAAPDDAQAIRALGCEVSALAEHMRAYTDQPTH
ncbi:hypothetical protein [Saccharomonospora saliphila]|uniref:hypothetical protein n=1 Tax=Saccharomonospora saliphila TaxID=369829 RepID=UPI000361DE4B|nr:hypothetical protein [Saccharomonospora saliphila]